jgi:hypothetical protein
VKKPFPWGVAITSVVLGLLLLGILAYAVMNQGAGFVDPLKAADKTVSGVQKYTEERDHVGTTVEYPQTPPAGGKHNPLPQSCAVYTAPIPNEHAVHSLEHGAVWVTYRPDLPAAQIETLKGKVEGNPFRLLSPFPGLKSAVSLQAWGRQIFVESASDPKVDKFLEAYTDGPQKPENGACQGNTTTGPLQAAPSSTTTIAPSPAASGAASTAPSAAPSASAK